MASRPLHLTCAKWGRLAAVPFFPAGELYVRPCTLAVAIIRTFGVLFHSVR